MKFFGFLITFVVLVQSELFAVEVKDIAIPRDIANPIDIVNGKPTNFTANINDNWYVFTLGADSNILMFGSDSSGGDIQRVFIYNQGMTEVYSQSYLTSTSISLSAGSYFINISESRTGKFAVYSMQMTNPVDTNPIIGSIVNPYLPKNGIAIPFGTETATNVYYFEMNESGNLLMSGADSSGGDIQRVFVYNESLAEVYSQSYLTSTSISLNAGKYYLMISESRTGSISIYSPVMSPNPIPPSHPSYSDGFNDGKQACIDDPESCGINVCGEKPKVIIFPYKSCK